MTKDNMAPPERICAFYSQGPHYVRLLRCLRENYPNAVLVAAIPATFPFDVIGGLVNETIRLPDGEERGRISQGWQVLRRLRQARCAQIVVMFDSPRLHLLSALSGARQRRCFTVDGRFYRLRAGFTALLADALARPIRGRWNYLMAWWGTRKM